MKLSTILFLFLFVSNIVGMPRRKSYGNAKNRDSSQRGNEQEEQNIPETEAHYNIHSSHQGMPVVASESPQQKIIKELLATLDGMEDGKLKGKLFIYY